MCYSFEEFWRNWIVQTQDWDLYIIAVWEETGVFGVSLLKFKIGAILNFTSGSFMHCWLCNVYVGPGLNSSCFVLCHQRFSFRSRMKILCLFIVLFDFIWDNEIVIWSSTFRFLPSRAELSWDELRLLTWTCCRIVNMGATFKCQVPA
jgi:hypothetical protein